MTLHLLTLSDRFIIALCTNPPRPLVGEIDRVGEERPLPGESAGERSIGPRSAPPELSAVGGSNLCELDKVNGVPVLAIELRGLVLSKSRDMPGICTRADDISVRSSSSTWFFR